MNGRFLYISRNYKHPHCGGCVARTDIEKIMESMGYANIGLRRTFSSNGIVHSLRNVYGALRAMRQLRAGDVVVAQYQMKMFGRLCRIAHKRGAKVICLIHDLDSWRDKKLPPRQEMPLLNMADVILTHNHAMRQWLEEQGCTAPMTDYEIMDYIHGVSGDPHGYPSDGKFSLFFVGNLSPRLNGWIYDLAKEMPHRKIYLYGSEYDETLGHATPNLRMCGERPDTDIIASHKGDFGISWYGISLDDGVGKVGEYMAINNPHKVGLYLRCNAPVVVWDKAGRAELIRKRGIGITVGSLRQLDAALDAVTPADYSRMVDNVSAINIELKSGRFLKKALKRAMEIINK